MIKFAITAGAVLAGLSVALGAFGAHAIAQIMVTAQRMETWETAAKYLMSHGQALILVSILAQVSRCHLSGPRSCCSVVLAFSRPHFSSGHHRHTLARGDCTHRGLLMISGWISLVIVTVNHLFLSK